MELAKRELGNLPTINDLYNEDIKVVERNQLNSLLNNEPKTEWLKAHPIAKIKKKVDGLTFDAPVLFIPIERIEFLLTAIFKNWRVEIKESKIIANSICVTVRVHVLDPIENEWTFQDGVGAMPIQTDKDAGAIDFNRIKSNAIQLALPAAESYAIKDAAEKFGKLFGKDMNRADQISYDNISPEIKKEKLKQFLGKLLAELDEKLADSYYSKIDEAVANDKDSVKFYQSLIVEIKPSEGKA